MKKSMWYTEGLNEYLSKKGFVHYLTRQKITEDFAEGRAFFFDSEKKEFGLSDMICSDNLGEAGEITKKFRESGVLEISK